MKQNLLLIVGMALLTSCAVMKSRSPDANSRNPAGIGAFQGPSGFLSFSDNQKTYSKYCLGNADSVDLPRPNYADLDVKKAAGKLSKIADKSFYFYSGVARAYGLKKGGQNILPPASAPAGTSQNAHAFLTILCGEFRDRAPMIEAKIRWVHNLYKLPVTPQAPIDSKKNVWAQFSANSYGPYIDFSRKLWQAKKQEMTSSGKSKIQLGKYSEDAPVDGQSVCETKYIISEYVAKKRSFENLGSFRQGYQPYETANCTSADTDYYYDFRGDSNFKPNSPEGNGMIWHSNTVSAHCASPSKAADNKLTDADCVDYFRSPFRNRYNAARAGLATWLFRGKQHDNTFSSEGDNVTMIPNLKAHSQPFSFQFDGEGPVLAEFLPEWTGLNDAYSRPDIGFNQVMGIGTSKMNVELAYERLRDAVNRHTDWYSSAYNDQMGLKRDQAYSPFVASSYDMSASDGFTAPGVTVASEPDGYKHWMFVFRVKKTNWYNTATLAKGVPVNFDQMWFDETSFGTNGLADSERAWDRLGTALEGELDSILYLHNIAQGGNVKGDGLPQF